MEQTKAPGGWRSQKNLTRLRRLLSVTVGVCIAAEVIHPMTLLVITPHRLSESAFFTPLFVWAGLAVLAGIFRSVVGRILDKNYLNVTTGVVTGYDLDSNGHSYIVVKGLNGVGEEVEQRKYIGAMAWRTYEKGSVYPKP